MKKNNMVRKQMLFFLLAGFSAAFLIGCGDGFRAATFDTADTLKKSTKAGSNPEETKAPQEKSVQEQILEDVARERAERERNEAPPTATADGKASAVESKKPETDVKNDPLKSVVEETIALSDVNSNIDEVKEKLASVQPELAQYLKGLTFSIRSLDDKKINLEILAVIQRAASKPEDRILADGDIAVENAEKKMTSLPTMIVKMHSMGLFYATSAEEMYAPSKNTKVGFVCADKQCETAYVLVRSRSTVNKETKLLELALELKRHGQQFEVVRSNASDKPLQIKSYQDAE